MNSKYCTRCGETKLISEYSKNRTSKDGLQNHCKACKKEISDVYNKSPQGKASQLKYNKTEKSKIANKNYNIRHNYKGQKKWIKSEKGKISYRNRRLKKEFGITIEIYDKMLQQQNYCCAVCNTHESEFQRRLHVDHCHETNKVRGLLCVRCNNALGQFKDNIDLFKSAIKYLKEFT